MNPFLWAIHTHAHHRVCVRDAFDRRTDNSHYYGYIYARARTYKIYKM